MAPDHSHSARPVSRRWPSLAVTGVGLLVALMVPVASLGAWLILTDPVVAADVAASGDLWPLAQAIVDALGRTLGELLRYL